MKTLFAGPLFALVVCSAGPVLAVEAELAVMPMRSSTLNGSTVTVLDRLLVTAVHASGTYRAISSDDVNALLGLEKMKEAAGCDDLQCAAEIAGALGVRFVLTASADVLGDQVILMASLIDTQQMQVVARKKHQQRNDPNNYSSAVEKLVAEILGGNADQSLGSDAAPASTAHVGLDSGETSPGREIAVLGMMRFGSVHLSNCPVDGDYGRDCNPSTQWGGLFGEYRLPFWRYFALNLGLGAGAIDDPVNDEPGMLLGVGTTARIPLASGTLVQAETGVDLTALVGPKSTLDAAFSLGARVWRIFVRGSVGYRLSKGGSVVRWNNGNQDYILAEYPYDGSHLTFGVLAGYVFPL